MRFRQPRTAQEKRQDDGSELVRGKRRQHRLPDAWDDQYPVHQRSWKKWRRTKWR